MARNVWLGSVIAVLVASAGVAAAGDGAGPRPPAAVTDPAGPFLAPAPGPAPFRIVIPIDIGAAINAWRDGELLVNRTRSGVRYNRRPARLLFSCEASYVLEVTPGEVVPGRPAAYDAGNTRACAAGEALYASPDHGLFCQTAAPPAAPAPGDPKLRAYSQIVLGGSPPLALLGVCVGKDGQVLPALSGGAVARGIDECRAPASGVRYRGRGRAGYTDCSQ